MNRAIIVAGLLLCVCTVAAGQDRPKVPCPTRASQSLPSLTSVAMDSFPRLTLTAPGQTSQAVDSRQPGVGALLSPRPHVPFYEFIVRAGGVYVRYPELGIEVPMSGGGASGCFDPDGVQRAWSREELLEVMLTPRVDFSVRVPSAAPN